MPQLVADRFVTVGTGTIDLATGLPVRLRRVALRDAAAARAWLDAAARRFAEWRSDRACLVDATWISPDEGIEASACTRPRALRIGGPTRPDRDAPPRFLSIRLLPRAGTEGVLAALDEANGGSLLIVPVRADRGTGLTTWLLAIAREMRRRGICPLAPGVLETVPDVVSLLRGRHVGLLIDHRPDGDVASDLARALAWCEDSGVRVACVVGALPGRWSSALRLDPIPPSRLAECLDTFPPATPPVRLALARRAGGLPGRLAGRWGVEVAGAPAVTRAEFPARSRRPPEAREARPSWASQATPAQDLVPAFGALEAGRAHDARRAFEDAIRSSGGEPSTVARAWYGLGLARLDLADLAGAGRALDGARLLAGVVEVTSLQSSVQVARARVQLWKGNAHAAHRLLADAPAPGGTGSDRHEEISLLRMRARCELALGNRTAGEELLTFALQRSPGDAERAAVLVDFARLHVTRADPVASLAYLRLAARHVRRARDRRRWLLLRVVHLATLASSADEDRRRADRLARRLLRRDVPPLIRVRVRHLLERFGHNRAREVHEFVRRWGSRTLEGCGLPRPAAPTGEKAMVRDLQAILEICRDAGEPLPALERVCVLLRDRLGAAVVSVHAPAERGRLLVAGSPRLAPVETVRRVIETGEPAAPIRTADGLEAATPVRYGGRTIGALACRWGLDVPVDRTGAELLLAGSATALAPHVHGIVQAAARPAVTHPADTMGLLGESAATRALRAQIARVAHAPFHVLIQGESGSGKELVARALHAAGPRRHRRFCAVNCAALTDDLLEAELFGHARGAFTGAVADRPGLFEEADGGTLFLDEVGELSLRAQAKLLRVIQDGEVRRVGETMARRVDARIVAATNRVLADEAAAGRFRADLLYRLDVIRINVVPLRERPEDVAVIARVCWAEAAARLGSRATLHPATLVALARYHWPGNVRELQNVIRALAVNAPRRGVVPAGALPAAIAAAVRDTPMTLDTARRTFEERFVRAALARAGHRPSQAARDLGLTRQGLRKLLLRLGIEARAPAGVAANEGAMGDASGRQSPGEQERSTA